MLYHDKNVFNNTTFEFPHGGFWILHVLGILAVFVLGVKLGWRRGTSLPSLAAEMVKLLAFRR